MTLTLVLTLLMATPSPAQLPTPAPLRMDAGADSAVAVVRAYDAGFRKSDAAAVAATTADDVEWTNAVGIRIRGRVRLQAFLTRLFAQPEIEASTDGPLKIESVRLVAPDVAVVSSTVETTGQVSRTSGKTVSRRTHEMSVLQRVGGKWLIVDDLISDEARDL